MPVVVETARGLEYAWVAYPNKEVEEDEVVLPLKPVIRIATENNAVNVTAMLLDYKNENFHDFDPMDEFSLDFDD